MAKSTSKTVPSAIAILDLQLALLREEAALHAWQLADASRELALMKRIRARADWGDTPLPLIEAFDAALARCMKSVSARDTTRMGAAHTSLTEAIGSLRDSLYD